MTHIIHYTLQNYTPHINFALTTQSTHFTDDKLHTTHFIFDFYQHHILQILQTTHYKLHT